MQASVGDCAGAGKREWDGRGDQLTTSLSEKLYPSTVAGNRWKIPWIHSPLGPISDWQLRLRYISVAEELTLGV